MRSTPPYVRPGQIYMCRFEDCWDTANAQISASLDRLQLPFCGKNNLRTIYRNTILANNKFDDIQKKVLDIFRKI